MLRSINKSEFSNSKSILYKSIPSIFSSPSNLPALMEGLSADCPNKTVGNSTKKQIIKRILFMVTKSDLKLHKILGIIRKRVYNFQEDFLLKSPRAIIYGALATFNYRSLFCSDNRLFKILSFTLKTVPCLVPFGKLILSEISVQFIKSEDFTAPILCLVYISK